MSTLPHTESHKSRHATMDGEAAVGAVHVLRRPYDRHTA